MSTSSTARHKAGGSVIKTDKRSDMSVLADALIGCRDDLSNVDTRIQSRVRLARHGYPQPLLEDISEDVKGVIVILDAAIAELRAAG